jgi:predicted DNA-binding transcriptional regulator AlpA
VTDLSRQLHDLADRVDTLDRGQVVGELERLKFELYTAAPASFPPAGKSTAPSIALDIDAVVKATGMSKPWLYREARAGRLPFARKLGRRFTFDEHGLTRWLERRRRP